FSKFCPHQISVKMKSLALLLVLAGIGFSTADIDCTVNGTFQNCPTACPETCAYNPQACIYMCGKPCVCKEGYIIDSSIPACVLRADCPAGVVQQKGYEMITNFPNFGR
ncbi:hypothetical protein KR222_009569, partial [Zaprionus bogoriensis]